MNFSLHHIILIIKTNYYQLNKLLDNEDWHACTFLLLPPASRNCCCSTLTASRYFSALGLLAKQTENSYNSLIKTDSWRPFFIPDADSLINEIKFLFLSINEILDRPRHLAMVSPRTGGAECYLITAIEHIHLAKYSTPDFTTDIKLDNG